MSYVFVLENIAKWSSRNLVLRWQFAGSLTLLNIISKMAKNDDNREN
jgi:hypothetical protein